MQHHNGNVYRPLFTLDLPSLPDHDAAHAVRLDPLTCALTRPAFLEALDKVAAASDQAGQPLAVQLIDVDQLRNINDRHGHRAGDAVLIEVARRLRHLLSGDPWNRLSHSIGRFDGGALIACSRRCDLDRGFAIAEQLRENIAAALIGHIRATVSIGVAQHRPGTPVDATLARAERVLQLAKQFGRDRVEVATSPAVNTQRAGVEPLPVRPLPRRSKDRTG